MNEDGGKPPDCVVSTVTQFRANNAAKIGYRTNPLECVEKQRWEKCASELTKKARRELQPPVFETISGVETGPIAQPHPGIGQVD
ncbi:hypothetical protein [Pseudoxanthomonas sacheonensis]|uniref:hypothetical protein n=1 Tax=Pseudoxanthomonas sacheonensis TaxID=443615 RepID=UPI0013D70D7C|nr:hypothetical protein [Pseudoxanthomonas sacheonensis]